mgnify:CR=1 FL=1
MRTLLPTNMILAFSDQASVDIALGGPFRGVQEMLACAEPVFQSWVKSVDSDIGFRDVDVRVEFNDGDVIYEERLCIFAENHGGLKATLYWLREDIEDWLTNDAPGYLAAKRLVDSVEEHD